jgi:hypothetical protein
VCACSPNSVCSAKGLPVLNERASVASTSTFTSLRLSSLATSAGWLLMVASSSADNSTRHTARCVKVANRDFWDFGWRCAHGAVTRRPPVPLDTMIPHNEGYACDVGVWGLSIVQGPFSVAPCQTLALRFAVAVGGAGMRTGSEEDVRGSVHGPLGVEVLDQLAHVVNAGLHEVDGLQVGLRLAALADAFHHCGAWE